MHRRSDIYRQRVADFTVIAEAKLKKYTQYTLVRISIFVVSVILTILLWSLSWIVGVLATMLFIYLFYRFILWHQSIKTAEQHYRTLVQINENELQVLEHEFGMFNDGSEFIDVLHPYAYDLDIFGEYSIFQYCNRTSTAIGRKALASWLSESANLVTIEQRVAAIKELSALLDWRQNFQAKGTTTQDSLEHLDLLSIWLSTSPFILNNKIIQFRMYIAPLFALLALYFGITVHWALGLLLILPNALLLRQTVNAVNEAHRQTTLAEGMLSNYGTLMAHIENQSFESALVQKNANLFTTHQAAKAIKRLSYCIAQLNVRYNFFAFILNLGGVWDLHWVLQLEKWKKQYQDLLPQWFDSLATFEALNSLTTMAYNNPDWVFPNLQVEGAALAATAIGHPLLPSQKRVTNDFHAPTQGHIKLVTGSNMAGKSTFLRTVGINLVLASIGAPVCATAFSCPRLSVYTSMRTQDALKESTSSFYAELKRLKFIIEAVNAGQPIYFLLDEILKGTNSKDRHTGSKALIKQLIESKGGGIIATHDLELGQLEAQYGGAIENLCMEVEIVEGKLAFDYKLKKGVSQSFNATILMQQMGIEIGNRSSPT